MDYVLQQIATSQFKLIIHQKLHSKSCDMSSHYCQPLMCEAEFGKKYKTFMINQEQIVDTFKMETSVRIYLSISLFCAKIILNLQSKRWQLVITVLVSASGKDQY